MSTVGAVYTADLAQFLDVYLASSRQQITALEQQRDALEVKTSIYTDLKSKLSTLRGLAEELSGAGTLSAFGAKTCTSSNSDALSATAGAGAVAMNHTLHVQQLARAHSVLSGRYTSTDTDLSGAWEGTRSFTLTVDGTDYDVSVVIGAGDSNEDVLTAVAAAINDVTDIPVRASKIDDTSSTSKLYIASAETGTENKMAFTDTDGLLAALGVSNGSEATDTVGGYIYADLGGNELDALFTLDGINIVRASNTVDDVLTGVTLNLKAEQEDTDADVALAIAIDTDAISSKVTEFLDAYNDAYGLLASKISVDTTTYTRGALAGDYSYVNLWQSMRSLMAGSVSSLGGGAFSALSQIGIGSTSGGQFSIADADDFETAVSNHLDAVESLFNSSDGVAARLEDLLDDYTAASGIIRASKNTVGDQIELLNDRIDRMETYQDQKEEQLIQQYSALQEASYQQQAILQMLGSLSSWLQG